jgi:hypothetical protein
MIAAFHAKFHHRSFLILKLFEYFDHSGSKYLGSHASGVLGALINDWNVELGVFGADRIPRESEQPATIYTCNQPYTAAGGPTHAQ